MKITKAKKWLMDNEPLMVCANKYEFQHRLQWLSEGVLHIHVGGNDWSISEKEKQNYIKYKGMEQ